MRKRALARFIDCTLFYVFSSMSRRRSRRRRSHSHSPLRFCCVHVMCAAAACVLSCTSRVIKVSIQKFTQQQQQQTHSGKPSLSLHTQSHLYRYRIYRLKQTEDARARAPLTLLLCDCSSGIALDVRTFHVSRCPRRVRERESGDKARSATHKPQLVMGHEVPICMIHTHITLCYTHMRWRSNLCARTVLLWRDFATIALECVVCVRHNKAAQS